MTKVESVEAEFDLEEKVSSGFGSARSRSRKRGGIGVLLYDLGVRPFQKCFYRRAVERGCGGADEANAIERLKGLFCLFRLSSAFGGLTSNDSLYIVQFRTRGNGLWGQRGGARGRTK